MNQPPGWFLRFFDEQLARADLLVHCGDLTGFALWQQLQAHPAAHAARGNCDFDPQLAGRVDEFVRLELDGPGFARGRTFSLAACHGWGPRSTVPERVAAHFGPDWDLVCFGHTHQPYFSDEHGVLLCNPGSLGEYGSWAELTVDAHGAVSCRFRTVAI